MAKKFKLIKDGSRILIESSESIVQTRQFSPEMKKQEIEMITDEIKRLKHQRRLIIKELKAINAADIGVEIKDIPVETN